MGVGDGELPPTATTSSSSRDPDRRRLQPLCEPPPRSRPLAPVASYAAYFLPRRCGDGRAGVEWAIMFLCSSALLLYSIGYVKPGGKTLMVPGSRDFSGRKKKWGPISYFSSYSYGNEQQFLQATRCSRFCSLVCWLLT